MTDTTYPPIASESCHVESHDCSKKEGKRPAGTVLNALNWGYEYYGDVTPLM